MFPRMFFVYIVTDHTNTHLYTGITNSLYHRLKQHYDNRGTNKSWAGRHNCHKLVYYEEFFYVNDAIAREKQLKGWRRSKKEALINAMNPDWLDLNDDFMI